jgi:phosphocarrier protein HPr
LTVRREVTIVNKLGLHARAAARLVTLASGYACEIHVRRGNKTVNGKSIMGVMMLAAGKGAVIELIAEGVDEQEAADRIADLVRQGFGEDTG